MTPARTGAPPSWPQPALQRAPDPQTWWLSRSEKQRRGVAFHRPLFGAPPAAWLLYVAAASLLPPGSRTLHDADAELAGLAKRLGLGQSQYYKYAAWLSARHYWERERRGKDLYLPYRPDDKPLYVPRELIWYGRLAGKSGIRAKQLLTLLYDYADLDGKCYPFETTQAKDLYCSVDTVQRALKVLADEQLIKAELFGWQLRPGVWCERYRYLLLRHPVFDQPPRPVTYLEKEKQSQPREATAPVSAGTAAAPQPHPDTTPQPGVEVTPTRPAGSPATPGQVPTEPEPIPGFAACPPDENKGLTRSDSGFCGPYPQSFYTPKTERNNGPNTVGTPPAQREKPASCEKKKQENQPQNQLSSWPDKDKFRQAIWEHGRKLNGGAPPDDTILARIAQSAGWDFRWIEVRLGELRRAGKFPERNYAWFVAVLAKPENLALNSAVKPSCACRDRRTPLDQRRPGKVYIQGRWRPCPNCSLTEADLAAIRAHQVNTLCPICPDEDRIDDEGSCMGPCKRTRETARSEFAKDHPDWSEDDLQSHFNRPVVPPPSPEPPPASLPGPPDALADSPVRPRAPGVSPGASPPQRHSASDKDTRAEVKSIIALLAKKNSPQRQREAVLGDDGLYHWRELDSP